MQVIFNIVDYTILPISEEGDTPSEFLIAVMFMRKFNRLPKRIRKRQCRICKKTGELVIEMKEKN